MQPFAHCAIYRTGTMNSWIFVSVAQRFDNATVLPIHLIELFLFFTNSIFSEIFNKKQSFLRLKAFHLMLEISLTQ